MPKKISVFYCFPRSGGTLLNQCLLCSPANVVLSEVNPAKCVMAVEKQATEWFHLFDAAESAEISDQSYLEKINLTHQRVQRAAKALCLRDWSGINFLAKISPWQGAPSQKLEQRIYLQSEGYHRLEIALLRRSRAVYQSIRENVPELSNLTPDDFGSAYRAYLQQISSIKQYQLESLINDPQNVLRKICTDLDLQHSVGFETRFHTIKTVTGNTTLPKPSVSAHWTSIHPNKVRPTTVDANNTSHANLFEELDKLAGYGHSQYEQSRTRF